MEVTYAGWATNEPVVTPLPSDNEILSMAQDVDVVVVPGELSSLVIQGCPGLRVIGVARGDPRGVDLAEATARRIPVVYAAGRNAEPVAEVVMAFMLMLFRGLIPAHHFIAERRWGTWDDLFATPLVNTLELSGRVLGLVGFGMVAREVARRAHAFNLRMIAYDPYIAAEDLARDGVQKVELPELLASSDVVSIHCKLSNETRSLLGREQLKLMKDGAYLINTARAAIVDESALLEALLGGRLAGAALDVYWEEPLSRDSPFIGLPNVIHTPHIAGATREVEARTAELVASDIVAVLRGQRPRHLANPEVLSVPQYKKRSGRS